MWNTQADPDHDRTSLDCRAFAAVLVALLTGTLLLCGASIGDDRPKHAAAPSPSHQQCACL